MHDIIHLHYFPIFRTPYFIGATAGALLNNEVFMSYSHTHRHINSHLHTKNKKEGQVRPKI